MNMKMMLTLAAMAAGVALFPTQAEASPTRAAATLEGSWRVEITLRNCATWAPLGQPFPAMASFDAAGTVITSDGSMSPAARGTGHGVWSRLNGRHFSATTEAFLFTDGARSGSQRLAQDIALGSDGQDFESTVGASVFNAAGQLVFSGCASSVGQRLD